MIVGRILDHLPRIRLTLSGREGRLAADFILDTGFDGYLTVPANLLRRLDAEPSGPQRSLLADGSLVVSPAYDVTVDWNGERRAVEALLTEGNPLIGTLFLDGCHPDIEMFEGGEVVIEPPA